MNAAQLLTHFGRLAEAPGAVPRLRRFILDLAVRGKLVEQDAADEPAAQLLKKIQIKKSSATRSGKTKKSGTVHDDEDYGPHVIPESWKWAPLGTLATKLTDGSHNPAPDAGQGHPMLSSKNVLEGEISFSNPTRYLSPDDFALEDARTRIKPFDVLLTIVGSIGRSAVVPVDAPQFALQRSVAVICTQLVPDFLSLQLRSPTTQAFFLEHGKGTAQKGIYLGKLATTPIAIPPLTEQRRIVAKVDELMALCDQLEAAQQERERRRDRLASACLQRLNQPALADPATDQPEPADARQQAHREQQIDHARFHLQNLNRLTTRPEHIKAMRQTFLNLAVRGKLLDQDANDEPATELLKKIRSEKSKLTRTARKNEVKLQAVDVKLAPYDLPSGWAWARFPELGAFGRGKSKHRPRNDPTLYVGGTHLLVQTGDVARSKGVIKTFTGKYNDIGLAQSMKWPAGTLCITIAANIADSGILSFDACFPDSVVGFSASPLFDSARYFEYFVRTAKANLLEFAPATAQKNINLEILNAVLIPLPPLAEQHRIVAKVDELMALCDQLEAQLTQSQTDCRRLLEAVLEAAIA